MKKKALLAVSTLMLSTSILAAVNCVPFVQEAEQLRGQVVNFDSEIAKVEKKVERLSLKISERMNEVQAVSSQMQQRSSQLQQIDSQIASLQAQRQQIAGEMAQLNHSENQLIAEMQAAQRDIQLYPAGSPGRRDALRRKKRAEKALEQLGYARVEVAQRDQAALSGISSSSNQRQAINDQLSSLAVQRAEIENRSPSISALQSIVSESQAKLAQMSQARGLLEQDLLQGEEKVLMCKTYNLKYPKVLSTARRIYRQGCENFEMTHPQDPYKAEAEQEIFNSICFQQ